MDFLDKIKNVVKGTEKNEADNKSSNKNNPGNSSFGGYTNSQIKNNIRNSSTGDSLTTPQLGSEAQKSLDVYTDKNSVIKVGITSSFSDVLATLYSEGHDTLALDKLRVYLNENKGVVEKKFWYMLMDLYQVTNDKERFEKAAAAFSYAFSTSPPSWIDSNCNEKKNLMAGKNILILEPTFKEEHTVRFKEFYKAAKQEKFCRINVSQCKFDQSDMKALESLYQLFTQLRKAKIMSVLMGDNNIIGFCKSYINPNLANKSLKQVFIEQEELFWLLYLEILQWKGKDEEFEELALEYAKKFEMSPPGWELSGIMLYDANKIDIIDNPKIITDKKLNSNNIESLFNIIKDDFQQFNKSEVELGHIERIDFESAGAISHFIIEIQNEEEHKNKEIIFKHPNEFILTLLEMLGVTEFVKIIPKNR